MTDLPVRHVCLDFHTSPLIPDVGTEFDAQEFARTLAEARVDWVTLHAKCHHGMFYYPTDFGVRHPGLGFDLFGSALEACHASGIKVEAYLSAAWDEVQAARHGDWLQVERSGRLAGRGPIDLVDRWRYLCLGSPYADQFCAELRELLSRYRPQGLLVDIVMQIRPGCYCNHCLAGMRDRGLDPEREADAGRYSRLVERTFMQRVSEIARSYDPQLLLWYNCRTFLAQHPELGIRPELPFITHVELESLPSGVWGYNHFPMQARFLQSLGVRIKGQTGRFHKSWGDFGGLKNQAALEYECFSMLAHGTGVSVGDQLHPRGRLDPVVYDRIGAVFRQVEARQPWCSDVEPQAEIGVLCATLPNPESAGAESKLEVAAADEGAVHALAEAHFQFQFVDQEADFSRYHVIVLPDRVGCDSRMAAKLRRYVGRGGALLASYRSGLNQSGDRFALPELGVVLQGPGEFVPSYIRVSPGLDEGIEDTLHVVYEPHLRVRTGRLDSESPPKSAAEPRRQAEFWRPYFQRRWDHFCGHAQAPPSAPCGASAVVRCGRCLYLAFPVFEAYLRHGNRVYRQLVRNCILSLLPRPLVRAAAPSTARITLMHQPGEDRRVLHILHYIPERRTKGADPPLDIVEDTIPLYEISVAVRLPQAPKRVYLAPQNLPLQVEAQPLPDGEVYASVVIPKVCGHQMVVFEGAN